MNAEVPFPSLYYKHLGRMDKYQKRCEDFTQQQHMIESDMVVQRPNQGKDDMIFYLQRKLKTQDVDVIFLYYTGHGTEGNGDCVITRVIPPETTQNRENGS